MTATLTATSDAGQPSWARLITALLGRQDLSRADAAWAMEQVMTAEATPAQLAGFLVALRAKGETVDELAGLVDTMLRHAVRIEVPGRCVDIVGTGGDRRHTVNISTTAAIVVAGAGRRVVKHGNRAASSASGAADVLEALGVRLDLTPERVAALAEEVGITFCFAQRFHPAFRHAAVARRELGVPTAFNFLGPLTNPAQPQAGAIGVADLRMAPIVAGVLAARGASALVFRGEDGLDELSTTAPSTVWVVGGGQVRQTRLDPAALAIPRASLADLRGGDAAHNAGVVRDLLAGKTGPIRDAVLLNAAAALVAADGVPEAAGAGTETLAADGVPEAAGAGTETLAADGVATALADRLRTALVEVADAVDSGAAGTVLDRWVAATRTPA